MSDQEETRLGRYSILGKLAQGGMAEVFLARHDGPQGFARTVVIKRILPAFAKDPSFLHMFLNEARLAALINHPNVVSIVELGEEPAHGSYYIVMEYLEGRDVKTIARTHAERGGQLPFDFSVRVVADACAGLHFAHELCGPDGAPLNLVHRDISLDNLIITYSGLVKVVDFGIAKAAKAESNTKAGQVKGKIAYMAPEVVRGGQVDRRADVWALGVCLYSLLSSGVRPFKGEGVKCMEAVLREEPAVLPAVPVGLWRIVERALTKDMAQRYPTARALQDDLERWLASSGKAITASALEAFMTSLFPAQSDPLRQRLLELTRRPSQPEVAAANEVTTPNGPPVVAVAGPPPSTWSGGAEVQTITVTTGESARTGSRRPVAIGAAAGVLVLLVIVVARALMPPATPARPPPAPPVVVTAPISPGVEAPAEPPPPAQPNVALRAQAPAPPPPPPPPASVRHPRGTAKRPPAIVEGEQETNQPEPAPLAARGPPGTLAFRVAPWAVVFLDGRQVGTTPFEPMTLPSGLHTVRLVNDELGVAKDLKVEVRAGETFTVRQKMEE